MKENTVDLDGLKWSIVRLILKEIKSCKYCQKIEYRKSASKKGWHIKILCSKNCDKCRRLFDDSTRYKADKNRDFFGDNVLWDKKVYYIPLKNGKIKKIIKTAGEWRVYYERR